MYSNYSSFNIEAVELWIDISSAVVNVKALLYFLVMLRTYPDLLLFMLVRVSFFLVDKVFLCLAYAVMILETF